MAGDTKNRICETALKLFNERGYAEVSLRDVAKDAGIAIGSLTYHFSKKEDLLAKMLADLHGDFEGMLDHDARGLDRLGCMLDLLAAARTNQEHYPFYFRNIDAIVRDSETMKRESIQFEQTLASYYAESLRVLDEDKIINLHGASPGVIACIMIAMHASWASPSSPAANGAVRRIGVDEAVATLLAASISDEYVEDLHTLCTERNIPIASD